MTEGSGEGLILYGKKAGAYYNMVSCNNMVSL